MLFETFLRKFLKLKKFIKYGWKSNIHLQRTNFMVIRNLSSWSTLKYCTNRDIMKES